MNTRIALSAAILTAFAAAANADYGTFASTDDPALQTFTVSNLAGDGTLSAVTATGFILTVGGTNYSNVTLKMDHSIDYTYGGSASLLGGGNFSFSQGTNAPLLTVKFDSATLTDNGIHASYNNGGFSDNVVFGGSLIGTSVIVNSQTGFDFSFTTAPGHSIGDGVYSSSFSASGNYSPVPEPASMAALGLGALGLLRRRRKA